MSSTFEAAAAGPHEIRKHSVTLAGHRTSLSLENAFWHELKRQAAEEGLSLNALISRIDAERVGNLSSAVRVFVLERLTAELRRHEDDRSGEPRP